MNLTEEKLSIEIRPIGYIHTDSDIIPRHWTVSDVEGVLNIKKRYISGLRDIKAGQRIVVIFLFHKSSEFTPDLLCQNPPHNKGKRGIFSICSPVRPNPIGMSVVEVQEINGGQIKVRGIDMLDGTPVLDIKPYIKSKYDCPSYSDKCD